MIGKILNGVAVILAAVACALAAYICTSPDWFYATYGAGDVALECPAAKIGLFESEWYGETCVVDTVEDGDIKIPSLEFWPLFPLHFPDGENGNPVGKGGILPNNYTFSNCEAALADVEDGFVATNQASAAVLSVPSWPSTPFGPADLANASSPIYSTAVGIITSQGVPPTSPVFAAQLTGIFTLLGACLQNGVNTVPACNTFIAESFFEVVMKSVYSFNELPVDDDDSTSYEKILKACTDDNIDLSNMETSQLLLPAGAAAAGVAFLLGLVAFANHKVAPVAALLALASGALVMAVLLILRGTPAASGVGEECAEDVTKLCYTGQINGTLGFVSVICSGVSAILSLVGMCLVSKAAKESDALMA